MFTTKNLLMLVGRHAIIAILAIGASVLVAVLLSQEITRLSDDVLKNRQLASALEERTELFAAVK